MNKMTYLGYPHMIIYGDGPDDWDYPCTIQIIGEGADASLGWYHGLMPGFDFSDFDFLGKVIEWLVKE